MKIGFVFNFEIFAKVLNFDKDLIAFWLLKSCSLAVALREGLQWSSFFYQLPRV